MRINRLLEHRPARARPLTALGASLVALAVSPLALAQAGEEIVPADGKKDGAASFDFAVLISPEARVSSDFGERADPVNRKVSFHRGTDIKAPMGTPVHTPGCGKVVFSAFREGYGETIEIAYGDGSKMRFAQLSRRMVSVGDEVRAGTVIGKVGASGRATGPHLHWGMKWHDARIDPLLIAGPMPQGR